ncbi:atp dependent lon protease family member [Holotrichia oblita]|nr:atp dependent lon protease family member [Holotrichia oblita]
MGEKNKKYNVFIVGAAVILPESVCAMDIEGGVALSAVTEAVSKGENIVVISQSNLSVAMEKAQFSDLHKVGTLCSVKNFIQDGKFRAKLTLSAICRVAVSKFEMSSEGILRASVTEHGIGAEVSEESRSLINQAKRIFREITKVEGRFQPSAVTQAGLSTHPAITCDLIANIVLNKMEDRLQVLSCLVLEKRIEILNSLLNRELEIIGIQKTISGKVKQGFDKHQRDFFLREQMRVIGEELGEDASEAAELLKKIDNSGMPQEVAEKARKEAKRLERLNPMSPELSITRNYLENLVELPWTAETCDEVDLKKAREVLDADHYGMKDVKDRIIEHIAVMQLNKKLSGQILCFVGPPGVGKTSIAESIARSLGRKFVRVSLGGVKDESEIRGHRKTYIGAMPGKVIAGMKKAGSVNPVFLFDEIDKMSNDHKGDPASAMLEVLDPVQNKCFVDHYMEVPYDLSRVLFICTANDESGIPWALADRLEVINLSSYMLVEKIRIAKEFLLPKAEKEHGLLKGQIVFMNDALTFLIENYTREAGVRELSRVISGLCRKIALGVVSGEIKAGEKAEITSSEILNLLGKEKYSKDDLDKKSAVGIVNGLSYTSVGGDVLKLEVVLTPGGKGELKLTGNLGNVMKESAQLALSITKSLAADYGIDVSAFRKNDIHIHVPGGAVPKDGPSAGVALTVALVSAFSGRSVRGDYALTGEITLSGKVLEIGGVREKVLSAYRYGIANVIMPVQNEKSLEKVPVEVKDKLNFVFANNIRDVLGSMLIR